MTRKKLIAGLAVLAVAAVAVVCLVWVPGDGEDDAPVSPNRPRTASRMPNPAMMGPVSKKVSEIASKVKVPPQREVARNAEKAESTFSPTLSEEDFGELLVATEDESIATRNEAWRIIDSLDTKEKIHWIGFFSKSKHELLRVASMKATRICFGMENFQRKTKTTYKDVERMREQAAAEGKTFDNVMSVSFDSLPTGREAAQINNIVRSGLKDESSKVKEEAMLAAASFDVDTSHTIYQYAMTSCDDDVRLAVLREAEYGDDDFRLRLQMAALDLGGEEVVKVASEGIEKATGQRFANSAEAFEWYEKNRTSTGEK